MWWRNDGATSGIGAPKNAIYGTIYDTVNGGTLTQQKLYERIVTESQYEVCTPFNPLDLLTRAAKVSFRDAVAAIDSHCVEDMVTEGEVASCTLSTGGRGAAKCAAVTTGMCEG